MIALVSLLLAGVVLVFAARLASWLLGLVLIVIALVIPILLLFDVINGGPVLEVIVVSLISLAAAVYRGVVEFTQRAAQPPPEDNPHAY